VIGAINGPAVTGGLAIALACNILVASDRARFADTHARVGVMPGWGLTARLPAAVGFGFARRVSLSGAFVSAAEALNAG
jgi:enoyl-CoA hydratase